MSNFVGFAMVWQVMALSLSLQYQLSHLDFDNRQENEYDYEFALMEVIVFEHQVKEMRNLVEGIFLESQQ